MPDFTQSFPRPDWVMLGAPLPDGRVQLWASKTLSHADLELEQRGFWAGEAGCWPDPLSSVDEFVPTFRDIRIIAHMKTFVIVEADDYGAAFEALFKQWRADDPSADRPAVEGRRAIEQGRRSITP